MRTISEKYDISLMTVEASIKRLSDLEFITIEKLPSFKYEDRTFNEYSFTHLNDQFLMLNPELLTLPISAKERGFLIFLQLLAVVGLNDIAETKIEDIAKKIGVTRQTASKHLKKFVENGYITKSKHIFICKYLFKNPKPNNTITL
jgi:DNA-binding MarR family transcriptional regulator